MNFLTLESAPCPPSFIDNIYEIFVEVAKNQSLTEYEYTTIAKNCNILPSTTTTTSTTLKSTTISPTTPLEPTTTVVIASTTTDSSIVTILESTTVSSTSTLDSVTTELTSPTTQSSKSTTLESTTISTTSTTQPASTSQATTTQSSKSTILEPTTVSTTSTTQPASTSQVTTTQSSKSTTLESTAISTTSKTQPTLTSQVTTTQSSKSTTLESTTISSSEPASTSQATTTQLSESTTSESTTISTSPTVEPASTSKATSTQLSESSTTESISVSTTPRIEPASTSQAAATQSSTSTALGSTTVSTISTVVQPVYAAANTCDKTCLVTIACVGTIFMCICILVMIKLKHHQNKKSRKVSNESHEYSRKHHAAHLQDHVINDSRMWRTNPGYTRFQGHSRNSSYNSSYLAELEPVRFVNQIYLPDNSIMPEENLNWHISSKENTFSRMEPAHQRNSRPKQNKNKHHKRNNSVDNPYSMDEFSLISNRHSPFNGPNPYSMGGSSFISNNHISFNGPVLFDSEIDRRTFPKNRIEQGHNSRRDLNLNQTRHRPRSHDPNLVIQRYVEQPSYIYPDQGIPEYRPARHYKKHHLRDRERHIRTTGEFIFDGDTYRQ